METLKEAFLAKYPKYPNILNMFEEANGCKAEWGSITKPHLAKFVAYMSERLAASSVKTYCAMVKSTLSLYSDVVELPKGYEAILSPRRDISQQTWLTDSEIEMLLIYEPRNTYEHIVRNQFCLGALTGARHSDYIKFSRENITENMISYVSEKTHIKSEIPLSPAVSRIITENEYMGIVGQKLADSSFNDNIRKICRSCGITERVKLYQAGEFSEGEKWEYISSHTARRSFATNLYLRGADLYSISIMMGHTNTVMTEGYIVCGLKKLSDNVMEYFKRFK